MLSCLWKLNSQTIDITVGSGSGSVSNAPIYGTYDYSYSQILYLGSEITTAGGSSGLITKLRFNISALPSIPSNSNSWSVYLGNTSLTTLTAGSTNYVDTSVLKLGFSGLVSFPAVNNWMEITLTTPFNYTGGNLIVSVLENSTSASAASWLSTSTSTNMTNFLYSNTEIPNPNLLPGAYTGQSSSSLNRPNIQLQIQTGPCSGTPNPGNTLASATNVCAGSIINLSLQNSTTGTGVTYQWQSSTDGISWTNVSSGGNSETYSPTVISTIYFRCAVTCSGNTAYSDEVQIITPALVNGTFTINSIFPTGSGNFATFEDAIDYIKCGINGPVVFNVAQSSGPYIITNPINIPNIYGTSTTNSITINGNGETITYNSSDANKPSALILNGVDHLTIDSLNIDVSAGAYGFGITFRNMSDSNIIKKSTILTNKTLTAATHACIVFTASNSVLEGINGSGNLLDSNKFVGGYYNIIMAGLTGSVQNTNNTISNNIFEDYYIRSITVNAQTNLKILSNDFSRPMRTNTGNGTTIYIGAESKGLLIDGNRIHNLYASQVAAVAVQYAIQIESAADSISPNLITNNLVYNIEGNGPLCGIFNTSGSYMKAYHNTFSFESPLTTSGAAIGFYQTGLADSIEFKNNIVYITRNGSGEKYAIYKVNALSTIASNHNVYYINSAGSGIQNIGFQSVNYPTLSSWQTATNQDLNSTVIDPLFINPSGGDFTFSELSIDNSATPVGVLKDINHVNRSLVTPDPGAFEYTAPVCTTPPVAGQVSSSLTNVCNGTNFSLTLTNNSIGAGQTYQWQTSATGVAPWVDAGVASSTKTFVTTQVSSNYYRCAITCSGITTYSDSILVTTPALVSGTYTINNLLPPSNTNFITFTDALNFIKCGINGPVVFNVTTGSNAFTFSEPLVINSIFGASSTNTITFKGKGDSIFYSALATDKRPAFVLNGAKHIIFDSLLINVSTGTYGWGIHLTNHAEHNIIRNCKIVNNITATSNNFAGIVISASATSATSTGDNGNFNIIENNQIVGGYYGITIAGLSAPLSNNNIVRNNVIEDIYYAGIYSTYQSNLKVKGNNISRPNRTNSGTTYGIYHLVDHTDLESSENKIHHMFSANTSSTSTLYGIYVSADGLITNPNLVFNNLVYTNEGNGIHYGIYNSGGSFMKAYHNTISLDFKGATAGATYGFYQSTNVAGIEFKNNIINITRGGSGVKYCIYKSTAATPLVSNNNVFYLASIGSGAQNIGYQTSAKVSLLAWQTATTQDAASLVVNPDFTNANIFDYAFAEVSIDNIGTPLGIVSDINGNLRSTTTPDPGAYEVSIVVPVKLTSFYGWREGTINMLSWQTASEVNSKGFEIERSVDNINFSTLDFVATKANNGNSNSTLNYNFSDLKPTDGNNYYRLKQIDNDGKTNYSNTILIKQDKISQIRITSVYPNPVKHKINVLLESPNNETVNLIVTDMFGKKIIQEDVKLNIGENTKQLNIDYLTQGTYLIKIVCTDGCNNTVFKFMKN